MYMDPAGSRMHRGCGYLEAYDWIKFTKAKYTTIMVGGKVICKGVGYLLALAAMRKHNARNPSPI